MEKSQKKEMRKVRVNLIHTPNVEAQAFLKFLKKENLLMVDLNQNLNQVPNPVPNLVQNVQVHLVLNLILKIPKVTVFIISKNVSKNAKPANIKKKINVLNAT